MDLQNFIENVHIENPLKQAIIEIELKEILKENDKVIIKLKYYDKELQNLEIRRKYDRRKRIKSH